MSDLRHLTSKFPRTPHLPWSPGASRDDLTLKDCSLFANKHVIVTEKMDGQNTSLTRDSLFFRSPNPSFHPSHSLIKQIHASIQCEIPENWRICGEFLFAKHSIHYTNLKSYFLVFAIINDSGTVLNWPETTQFCHSLNLHTVPVISSIEWNEPLIRQLCNELDTTSSEGIVIRNADTFPFHEWPRNTAKFVRPNHVSSNRHWSSSPFTPNLLHP